jgi:predicted amidophosphoribosyltransferase
MKVTKRICNECKEEIPKKGMYCSDSEEGYDFCCARCMNLYIDNLEIKIDDLLQEKKELKELEKPDTDKPLN